MSNSTTAVLVKIVELLTPLSSDERQRVIHASLTLLGDSLPPPIQSGGSSADTSIGMDDSDSLLSPRVKIWLKQNGVSVEELEQVFHFDTGTAEFIGSWVPGNTDKEKTLNAYLICGLSSFLASGTSNFDDKTARALCKDLGCYNESNHAAYMKDKGNEFSGSKEKGWTLTSPGTKRGATLIKEISKLNV